VHNQLLLLPRDRDDVLPYRTGVSLHGHTRHSREGLGFIQKFLKQGSLSRRWYDGKQEECRRKTGIALDLERAYWTPPLTPASALHVERKQIAALGLHRWFR